MDEKSKPHLLTVKLCVGVTLLGRLSSLQIAIGFSMFVSLSLSIAMKLGDFGVDFPVCQRYFDYPVFLTRNVDEFENLESFERSREIKRKSTIN